MDGDGAEGGLAPRERVGVVRRLGTERRFDYVETTKVQELRLYIFVAGTTASHRTVGQLCIGSRVLGTSRRLGQVVPTCSAGP